MYLKRIFCRAYREKEITGKIRMKFKNELLKEMIADQTKELFLATIIKRLQVGLLQHFLI